MPISGDGVEEDRSPVTNAREYLIQVLILFEPTLQKSETSESEESPVISPSVLVTNVGEDEGAAKKRVFAKSPTFARDFFGYKIIDSAILCKLYLLTFSYTLQQYGYVISIKATKVSGKKWVEWLMINNMVWLKDKKNLKSWPLLTYDI